MSSHRPKLFRDLCLPFLVVGLLAQFAHAAVVNGTFSAGATGWTVSDSSFVNFTNGQAVILEHNLDSEVYLAQHFTIPTDALTLSFDLFGLITEADVGFLPDAFNVSLLDAVSLVSMVPSVDIFSDAYYTRDLLDGITQGIAATGVSLSPSGTALPMTISLDVAALSGREAILQFKLIGGGGAYSSSATLDNIRITAVPEPSSWLVILAVACVGCGHRRRKDLPATIRHEC